MSSIEMRIKIILLTHKFLYEIHIHLEFNKQGIINLPSSPAIKVIYFKLCDLVQSMI